MSCLMEHEVQLDAMSWVMSASKPNPKNALVTCWGETVFLLTTRALNIMDMHAQLTRGDDRINTTSG